MERRQNLGSRKDLTGQIFGRLTAIKRDDSRVDKKGRLLSRWICKCSCGKEKSILMSSLICGLTRSCGCLNVDTGRAVGLWATLTHGGASMYASVDNRIRFQALQQIRRRARKNGYETDLELSDIPQLPDTCPALGLKFKKSAGPLCDNTPSVDRVNTNLPYLRKFRDNLRFISYKANRMKSNASLEELKMVVSYVENNLRRHSEGSEKSSLINLNPEIGNKDQAELISAG